MNLFRRWLSAWDRILFHLNGQHETKSKWKWKWKSLAGHEENKFQNLFFTFIQVFWKFYLERHFTSIILCLVYDWMGILVYNAMKQTNRQTKNFMKQRQMKDLFLNLVKCSMPLTTVTHLKRIELKNERNIKTKTNNFDKFSIWTVIQRGHSKILLFENV